MIKRLYSSKVFAFSLVLSILAMSLAYTNVAAETNTAAAPTITHVGQPVKNIVTLTYDSFGTIGWNLVYPDLTVYKNGSKPVPNGYSLVITDICVKVRAVPHSAADFALFMQSPTSTSVKMISRTMELLENRNGTFYGDFEEHYTTGVVLSSANSISLLSHKDYAMEIYIRGYLVPEITQTSSTSTGNPVPGSAAPGQPPVSAAASGSIPQVQRELLTGTSTVIPNTASTPTAAWTGSWTTSSKDIGSLELIQSGNSVTGTIGNGKYLFVGTISGKDLTAVWQEPETEFNGNVLFTLSADGKSFLGKWKTGSSLDWQTISGKKL